MFATLLYDLAAKRDARFALFVVSIVLIISLLISLKVTRGIAFGYWKVELNNTLRSILIGIQIFGSLILAMILPNNYLDEIEFVRDLYEGSQLWIPVSMVVLLLFFVSFFGILFTFFIKKYIRES